MGDAYIEIEGDNQWQTVVTVAVARTKTAASSGERPKTAGCAANATTRPDAAGPERPGAVEWAAAGVTGHKTMNETEVKRRRKAVELAHESIDNVTFGWNDPKLDPHVESEASDCTATTLERVFEGVA